MFIQQSRGDICCSVETGNETVGVMFQFAVQVRRPDSGHGTGRRIMLASMTSPHPAGRETTDTQRNPRALVVALYVCSPRSKYQLHLDPHAADAAVRKITIQKVKRTDAVDWNLSELWMVEGIQSFPPEFQSLLFCEAEGLG